MGALKRKIKGNLLRMMRTQHSSGQLGNKTDYRLSAKSCNTKKVKSPQMSEHCQSISELWRVTCFTLMSSVCFFTVRPSTGAEKEQAPTCTTVIQTWLIYPFIYLLLLSRGIHYSANHSLANAQYKCHDRYYYIHIDHWWRDSVGKVCSVLWCNALHWHSGVCQAEIKPREPWGK